MSPIHAVIFLVIFLVPLIIAAAGANLCCERKGFSKGWIVGVCLLPIILFFLETAKPKKENIEKASGGEITCVVITAVLFVVGIIVNIV